MKTRHLLSLLLALPVLALAQNNKPAEESRPPTPGPDVAPAKFVHPGIFTLQSDLDRVRAGVAAGKEPWKSAWQALQKTGPDENFQPHVPQVITDVYQMQNDGHSAYVLAAKWVASGDPKYARAAIGLLDAWTGSVTSAKAGGTLRNGLGAIQMVNAAEIIAHGFGGSAGWPAADVKRAQRWFAEILYPVLTTGRMRSAGWGTPCLTGAMSIAVFCDDRTMFNDSVFAYEHGFTNTSDGAVGVTQYIDATGENAESGRDQPHSQGSMAHLMEVAVIAYNQGLPDVMAFGDHRIVTGFEYSAKYNLGQEVSYHPFKESDGRLIYKDGISAQGRGNFSPMYEMANYYFTQAGYPAPYTKQVCESPGYRPEYTNSDHPGLGTLFYGK